MIEVFVMQVFFLILAVVILFFVVSSMKKVAMSKILRKRKLKSSGCRQLGEKEKVVASLGVAFTGGLYQGGGAFSIEGAVEELSFYYQGSLTETRYYLEGLEVIFPFDAFDHIKEYNKAEVVDVGEGKVGVISLNSSFDIVDAAERNNLHFRIAFLEGRVGILEDRFSESINKKIEVLEVFEDFEKKHFPKRYDSESLAFASMHLFGVFASLIAAGAAFSGLHYWMVGFFFLLPLPVFICFIFILVPKGFNKDYLDGSRVYKVKGDLAFSGEGVHVAEIGPVVQVYLPPQWRDVMPGKIYNQDFYLLVRYYGGCELCGVERYTAKEAPLVSKKWVPFAGPAYVSMISLFISLLSMYFVGSLPLLFYPWKDVGEVCGGDLVLPSVVFVCFCIFLTTFPAYCFLLYRYRRGVSFSREKARVVIDSLKI